MSKEIKIDQILWDKIRKGDEVAFRQLYNKYVNHLFFFASKYCNDSSIIEDSIQDLFIDLFYYHSKLGDTNNVRYYLYRSLRRKIAKAVKKTSVNNPITEEGYYQFFIEYPIEDELINTERKYELFKAVKKEMEALPKKQQEALYLRFLESMSYDEISEIMNINAQSIRMNVYRALKTIRKNIEKRYNQEAVFTLLPIF